MTLIVVVIMILSTIGGYFVINDDESTNEIDEPSQFSRWDVHFASSDSDLPECEWMTWGRLYYVENSNQFQVCKTVGWEEIQIIGPAGNDGLNGSIGDQGQPGNDGITTLIRILSSSSCPSGGNSFEIGPDNNGDGLLDITEVEVNVDICNGSDGIQGIQGIPGLNGTDGQDGTNGVDGLNGTDGQDGTNGVDGQDGAQGIPGVNGTDGQDGINGTDGQDGAQGPQGIPGVNGTDGLNALVSMTNESAGSNCANGGVRIDVGVDDTLELVPLIISI